MSITLGELQQTIRDTYGEKDRQRGVPATFMWFLEEVGELATALRSGSPEEQAAEFADVLAWLTTLANGVGVDLSQAIADKYGAGCPGCKQVPCACALAEKP
jgi:NTP pyrophosphatase (non-canonical NTP hydrolase)